jgi:hypothetical protein
VRQNITKPQDIAKRSRHCEKKLVWARGSCAVNHFSAGLIANYSLQHPEVVRGQILTNSLSAFSPPTRYGSDEDREAQAKAIEAEGLRAIEKFRFHPRYAKRFPTEIKQAMLADAARLPPKGLRMQFGTRGPSCQFWVDLKGP